MNQLPPQNRDAERGVLSACIGSAQDCAELRDVLAAEDFYFDAHQKIFRAICDMRDHGRPVDYVTLSNEMARVSELKDVGGTEYIRELIDSGGAVYATHYASIVLHAKIAREMIHVSKEVIRDAHEQTGPVSELLDSTQQRFAAMAAKILGENDNVEVASAVNSILDMIDRRTKGERQNITSTGYDSLDRILNGGFRPGHLIILAARPSVGKTALAVNLTLKACMRGESVLFISLEQSSEELTGRLMAGVSGVAGTGIMRGALSDYEISRISRAADEVRKWRLSIRDRAGMTASQIAGAARLAKRRYGGLNLLVVDYLNEMRGDEGANIRTSRNELLGSACRRLRECAKSLGVPCLLLAQLNREVAKESEIPRLHHLRDSGEIEQIADVVTLLHREEAPEDAPEQLRLFVVKHRNGALGSVRYDHDAPRFVFTEAFR